MEWIKVQIQAWMQSWKKVWESGWKRAVLVVGILLLGTVSGYLAFLYQDLKEAFYKREEFVPTRIYSDVTRIAPPQRRPVVESRLRQLGYSFSKVENNVHFELPSIRYPLHLLPENHPTIQLQGKAVVLHFDGNEDESRLQSIEADGKDWDELYLEPELVATLHRASVGKKDEIRSVIPFRDFPPLLWKAIIAVEDQSFMVHPGFDIRGLVRAMWINLKTLSFAQGGSTITQQLVKNLTARKNKDLFKKINEIFLAILLEFQFSKEQILERYLNEVYLGQVGSLEVHGVWEGAKHFFGKRLNELNLAEMALAAGLIRGPGFYSPYRHMDRAADRQRTVLKKMLELEFITAAEEKAALEAKIELAPPSLEANKAPYFTDFVKAELIRQMKNRMSEEEIIHAGFQVYTSLDVNKNKLAQQILSTRIDQYEKQWNIPQVSRLEGALASVNPATGMIDVLVGGRDYEKSTFNRVLNMKRQVGSVFKPIVYLSALLKGEDQDGVVFGGGYPVWDAPWTLHYDHGRQSWSPQNYEKGHTGWLTFRSALSHSNNIAAAKIGARVGIAKIVETARLMGIDSDLPQVPSLSLGVAELSPIELLRAYATLANRGSRDELSVIRAITDVDGVSYARFMYHPTAFVPTGAADLMTDLMQDVFTTGTARSAAQYGFDRPAAGKTGTTSDYRDSWFAGYTPELTTVVWVGLDRGVLPKGMQLTGAQTALPIWAEYMSKILAEVPPVPFVPSENLVSLKIDSFTGQLANPECTYAQVAEEKYVSGTEPKLRTCGDRQPDPEEATLKE